MNKVIVVPEYLLDYPLEKYYDINLNLMSGTLRDILQQLNEEVKCIKYDSSDEFTTIKNLVIWTRNYIITVIHTEGGATALTIPRNP